MRWLLPAFAILIAACGSSSTHMLRLGSGDVSEDEFRVSVRQDILDPGSLTLCHGIQGLSARDIFVLIQRQEIAAVQTATAPTYESDNSTLSIDELNAKATVLTDAGHKIDAINAVTDEDARRAGQIVKEECDRVTK